MMLSSARKRRPCTGSTPSTFNRCASTMAERTRNGRSPASRFDSLVRNAPTAAKERLNCWNSSTPAPTPKTAGARVREIACSGTSAVRGADTQAVVAARH